MTDEYILISPVTIEKRIPAKGETPEKTEKRTVTSFRRRAIRGSVYFDHGDIDFIATAPGGNSYEVELDAVIDAYLRHQIDDPDAELILDALKLPDALSLRQDLADLFTAATTAARTARAGADPEAVKLIDPPEIHNERVADLKLSEPRHRDFARHGRPFTWTRTSDGTVQPMERMTVIRRYLERSIQHDMGGDILPFLGLADAMQLKRCILGFFTRAADTATGARSSINSSSTADGSASTPATA